MGNGQSDSTKNEQHGNNSPPPRKRNLLPKEKLRQRRHQRQQPLGPIVEFPDEETPAPQQRGRTTEKENIVRPEEIVDTEDNELENESPRTNSENDETIPKKIENDRPKPIGRHFDRENHVHHWKLGQDERTGYHRQKTFDGLYRDAQLAGYDGYNYANNNFRRSYPELYNWSNHSRLRPPGRSNDSRAYRHVPLSTKLYSQKTNLIRPAEERYSRMKPTEKPSGYVLVRRSFDPSLLNKSTSSNVPLKAQNINGEFSEKFGRKPQNAKEKVSNSDKSVPKPERTPYSHDIRGSSNIGNSNEKIKSPSPRDERENAKAEVNSWMKGNRTWNL